MSAQGLRTQGCPTLPDENGQRGAYHLGKTTETSYPEGRFHSWAVGLWLCVTRGFCSLGVRSQACREATLG